MLQMLLLIIVIDKNIIKVYDNKFFNKMFKKYDLWGTKMY